MNRLIIASAGSGKTTKIVREAAAEIRAGKKVLLVTYTESNQEELKSKVCDFDGMDFDRFIVKGFYTFLLEEIIRPYLPLFFPGRPCQINRNNDGNPHLRGRFHLPNRSERKEDGTLNPQHFLNADFQVHTMFISKLACRILKESELAAQRLKSIYSQIFFDEVQDLVGWDFHVIGLLADSGGLKLTCVGDFRQTIYETHFGAKGPKTHAQKKCFLDESGFVPEELNTCWRSVQRICDFADQIHDGEGFPATVSVVEAKPSSHEDHQGVFVVGESSVSRYIETFNPVLLRYSVSSAKDFSDLTVRRMNFGVSKGLTFQRTLIFPTTRHKRYLFGDHAAFEGTRSSFEKNKFYVAVTRARFSVAFIVKDCELAQCNLPVWTPLTGDTSS